MTHLEIHDSLEKSFGEIILFLNEDPAKDQNSVLSLALYILNSTSSTIDYGISILQKEPEFCLHCLYLNISVGRRAIHRYLLIETEIEKKVKALLQNIQDRLNEICIELKSQFPRGMDESCNMHVTNTAYNDLLNRRL